MQLWKELRLMVWTDWSYTPTKVPLRADTTLPRTGAAGVYRPHTFLPTNILISDEA
jgi:hypothetical protein